MEPKPRAPVITERVWRYVARGPSDQCWLWGGIFLHALPVVKLLKIDWEQLDIETQFGSIVNGENSYIPAARVVWGILNGSVPVDQVVANTCHNNSCVNPAHRKLGHYQDIADNRVKNKRVAKGDTSRSATMSNALAKQIYDEYHSGETTQRDLAEMHGLRLSTIRSLCQGRTWTSVTGAIQKTWSRDSSRRIIRAKNPRNRFIEKA